nr:MAG TPA: hypothetical protein [Caudoviricetes sp.]
MHQQKYFDLCFFTFFPRSSVRSLRLYTPFTHTSLVSYTIPSLTSSRRFAPNKFITLFLPYYDGRYRSLIRT